MDANIKTRIINSGPNLNDPLWWVAIMVIAAAFFFGCSRYPFGLQEEEWNALSKEQQVELANTEELFDQYNLDTNKCSKESAILMERQFGTRYIGNVEKVEIHVGHNKEVHEKCMERLGWSDDKLQLIINWIDDSAAE